MWLIIFSLLSECPSGWEDGGHLGCYLAAVHAPRMSQLWANAYCKRLDRRAHLAEIRTWQIQEFVSGLEDLNDRNWYNHFWWLGGSDRSRV